MLLQRWVWGQPMSPMLTLSPDAGCTRLWPPASRQLHSQMCHLHDRPAATQPGGPGRNPWPGVPVQGHALPWCTPFCPSRPGSSAPTTWRRTRLVALRCSGSPPLSCEVCAATPQSTSFRWVRGCLTCTHHQAAPPGWWPCASHGGAAGQQRRRRRTPSCPHACPPRHRGAPWPPSA